MDGGWIDETLPGRYIVHVQGDLDLETGPPLRDHLATVLARAADVVIDLTDVTFCDSSGLGALVATRRRAFLLGKRVSLRVAEHGRVHRLLELTGLIDTFEIEAVAELAQGVS